MKRLLDWVATLPEVARVCGAIPRVELYRGRWGPLVVLRLLRARGRRAPARDEQGRRRLRRAIAWVDWCFAGGNCYRRVLLETVLDRGAAAEPVALGFHAHGAALSGHAWVDRPGATAEPYDFTVRL